MAGMLFIWVSLNSQYDIDFKSYPELTFVVCF